MHVTELWRRGVKQHFKGLSDHPEKCQVTTYGVLCPNRSCHHFNTAIEVYSVCKYLQYRNIYITIHQSSLVSCADDERNNDENEAKLVAPREKSWQDLQACDGCPTKRSKISTKCHITAQPPLAAHYMVAGIDCGLAYRSVAKSPPQGDLM